MKSITLELTRWEHAKIQHHVAVSALNWISHFRTGGLLNMQEFNEMEHWRAFAAKLNGEKFTPMDPESGKVRDWDSTKILSPTDS